jgi:hypothetical protein
VSVLGTVGQTVLGCPQVRGILTTDPIANRPPMASHAVAGLFPILGPRGPKPAPTGFLESNKGLHPAIHAAPGGPACSNRVALDLAVPQVSQDL